MLQQVSIYAENQKGAMLKITEILLREEINIWGSVTNDSAEYGIVRMIVSDPQKARKALDEAGYMTKLTDVLGVEVEDRPGSLNTLLLALADSNISLNYIYLSFNRDSGMPVMVFQTDDAWEVEGSLKERGFRTV